MYFKMAGGVVMRITGGQATNDFSIRIWIGLYQEMYRVHMEVDTRAMPAVKYRT
jgi:hypothetical protein